ncbi:MAG: type II secretion system protein [Acidobacteria bacterium]|nr:type II secretion system protein [Acidobacteriota bacterium]
MKLAASNRHPAEKHGKHVIHASLSTAKRRLLTDARGFSLLELVITLTVLTILTMGILPLVKVSVRRQREQRLRETLREMRLAIQEFHQDTIGSPCTTAAGATANGTPDTRTGINPIAPDPRNPNQPNAPVDPRSRVVITDCKIFTVDNPDRYPPDLDTLVNGVSITPRGGQGPIGGKIIGLDGEKGITDVATNATSTKKKVYLRAIPVDPITGEAEWELRSSYDAADATSWGKENVFDVRSKAEGTALNGEKYSDW